VFALASPVAGAQDERVSRDQPMRFALIALAAAAPAVAQSPSSLLDPDTCGAYVALDDPARIQMLTTIEPFGDDIDAEDQDAAMQWADEVGAACDGHPNRPLSDAAIAAMNPG
jgi:hypothetical protein